MICMQKKGVYHSNKALLLPQPKGNGSHPGVEIWHGNCPIGAFVPQPWPSHGLSGLLLRLRQMRFAYRRLATGGIALESFLYARLLL